MSFDASGGRNATNVEELELAEYKAATAAERARLARARADAAEKYANKAGRVEQHHVEPKYLGGPSNGRTVPLDASYHQLITNAFRDLVPYGTKKLSPAERKVIMKLVYSKLPLG